MASLSITAAWNETATFVKREAALLFPLAFMLIALPVAVMEAVAPAARPGEVPEAGPWLVMVPVAAVAAIVGNIAISYLALRPGTSVAEALARGLRRLLPMLGAVLVLVLVCLVLFFVVSMVVVLAVPGAIAVAAAAPGAAPDPAILRATLIMLVILVPIILFFAVRLMLMTPAAAAEDIGPLAIIRRSWRLTSGHFWKLLGFVLLVGILFWVLSFAINAVGGSIAILVGGPLRPGSTSAFLIILLMAAVNTLVTPLMTSLIARIYAQLAGAVAQPSSGI